MNKKPIIIALVGPSGSGKTTLSLYLQDNCGIPAICSYTTRLIRPGEVNGRDHWFVSPGHPIPRKPLAYTFFGGNHYWAETAQVDGLRCCTYVIDERGLIELQEKWGDRYEILSVRIERPNREDISEERKKRDEGRSQYDVDLYDIILCNDTDLHNFIKTAVTTIATFIY